MALKIYKKISVALHLNTRQIKKNESIIIKKDNLRPVLAQLIRENIIDLFRTNYSFYIRQRCGSLDIIYPSNTVTDWFQEINLPSINPSINKDDNLQIEELYVEPNIQLIGKNNFSEPKSEPLNCILSKLEPQESLKWIVYGRAGYGKTSLLKYLVIECYRGKFRSNYVPIYISFKRYKNYINKEGQEYILNYIVKSQSELVFEHIDEYTLKNQLNLILSEGKVIFFFDGMDITDNESFLLFNSIKNFIDWYPKNSFIISSRGKLNSYFNEFKEYEIEELNNQKIKDFLKKRINYFFKKESKEIKTEKINNLYSLIKQKNIEKFASSPLILAYICLSQDSLELKFATTEDEKKFLLCKSAIFKLLEWDNTLEKSYDQDDIYKNMPPRKRADFLSHLAIEMIKNGKEDYIPLSELINYSARFIFQLPNAENQEEFRLKSKQLLLAIETQDGLLTRRIFSKDPEYSFPHKTVRDFFAAWWLSQLTSQEQLEFWKTYSKSNEEEWRNIFEKVLILNKIQLNELTQANQNLKETLGIA